MHHGPLFAQVESSGRGQHETNCLDKQRPLAQVTSNDEATQDALYLFVHKIVDVSYIDSTVHKHNQYSVEETSRHPIPTSAMPPPDAYGAKMRTYIAAKAAKTSARAT